MLPTLLHVKSKVAHLPVKQTTAADAAPGPFESNSTCTRLLLLLYSSTCTAVQRDISAAAAAAARRALMALYKSVTQVLVQLCIAGQLALTMPQKMQNVS